MNHSHTRNRVNKTFAFSAGSQSTHVVCLPLVQQTLSWWKTHSDNLSWWKTEEAGFVVLHFIPLPFVHIYLKLNSLRLNYEFFQIYDKRSIDIS